MYPATVGDVSATRLDKKKQPALRRSQNVPTLKNKVGFSTVQVSFLFNEVAERSASVAGLIKIEIGETLRFWDRPPLSKNGRVYWILTSRATGEDLSVA